jgi:DNA polymerase I
LHGDCYPLGTPSMRARHNIIVNVPAADSVWGKEMRALFSHPPGWKLIGADSAGNQARGLAHYLESPDFTHQLINGDIHTYNANILDAVLKSMGISWDSYLASKGLKPEEFAKRKRANAKRILYAFLFGASGSKLWGYIFDTPDDDKGKRLKLGFTKAVPGFKKLSEKLENIFGGTKQKGEGYILGIAGNRIYCDSFHKLLVYLLQACEKATCSAALMLTVRGLNAENIPYQPCIMMHDEIDFTVPEAYAERAAVIAKEAFKEGPKLFGVDIMDGEAKIGNNWYDVH